MAAQQPQAPDHKQLASPAATYNSFRVRHINHTGQPQPFSNIV